MPGYVIHLAVAKKFLEKHKEYNEEEFIEGIIAPDLLKEKYGREKTHYGVDGKNTSSKKFMLENKFDNGYNAGYYLHLITDEQFYNKYFTKWSPKMYNDYNILNNVLVREYELTIPDKVSAYVKSETGVLTFLDKEKVKKFIEDMSNINLENYNFEY